MDLALVCRYAWPYPDLLPAVRAQFPDELVVLVRLPGWPRPGSERLHGASVGGWSHYCDDAPLLLREFVAGRG